MPFYFNFPQCLHEKLSHAKAKALRKPYANTPKNTAVILNAYFFWERKSD